MSQFPVPLMASMPAYLDSQYVPTVPSMMHNTPQPSRSSPQAIPPSPSSSQSEHRVSKAKKGKRVHACEYAGCDKVFTRAEHRRRHELSHRSMKLYACAYEGCVKAFHRADYLTQHMARQSVIKGSSEQARKTNSTAVTLILHDDHHQCEAPRTLPLSAAYISRNHSLRSLR